MTGPRRRERRQGVVYGPLVTREQREPGSLLGRLLGGVVVFGALAVLAIGALAVLGGANTPRPTPTPTLAGAASPSPTATNVPTPTPTPSPSAPPSATPAPSATPFPVELVEGPNAITFATNYTSGLDLIEPHVDFGLTGPIAWRAHIGEAVGDVRITWDVSRIDPATLAETITHSSSFSPRNPDAVLYYSKSRVERLIDGAGIYAMRYRYNGEVIAEGYFTAGE